MTISAPTKGKCFFWRETANVDDEYDSRIKREQKRVDCACFVEGDVWRFKNLELPADCPDSRRCRYYIKSA